MTKWVQESESLAERYRCSSVRSDDGDGFALSSWIAAYLDVFDGEEEAVKEVDEWEAKWGKHSYSDSYSCDVVQLLPSDPFGEQSSSVCEITGCFRGENLSEFKSLKGGELESNGGRSELFSDLNLSCKSSFRYLPNLGWEVVAKTNGFYTQRIIVVDDLVEEVWNSCHEADMDACPSVAALCGETSYDNGGDEPHFALFLVLHYLGTEELLSLERVCKSLNYAIENDPSLWMNVHVDCPLNSKLTNDSLVRLTNRAGGLLRSLTLVGCFRVTDAGIKRVVECNPNLKKLNVPGCMRITMEGIIRTLRSAQDLGIKQLRIGRCGGITNDQYDELRLLIGADDQSQHREYKPRYYSKGQLYSSFDDNQAIDLEKCPRCKNVRFIYDCPAESCQKNEASKPCKACIVCIARCITCGCCLNGRQYIESFFLDPICLVCIEQVTSLSASGQKTLCEDVNYRLCMYA